MCSCSRIRDQINKNYPLSVSVLTRTKEQRITILRLLSYHIPLRKLFEIGMVPNTETAGAGLRFWYNFSMKGVHRILLFRFEKHLHVLSPGVHPGVGAFVLAHLSAKTVNIFVSLLVHPPFNVFRHCPYV